MRQRYAYGSNIAAVRCGWDVKIKSNGESKIAESKAALCYGFAIALRALFRVILCSLIATLALLARNDPPMPLHTKLPQKQEQKHDKKNGGSRQSENNFRARKTQQQIA